MKDEMPNWTLATAAVLGLAIIAAGGCAKRIPLPEHLSLKRGLEELGERMAAASPKVEKYSAEVRLTYFGPQGRMKGSAIIAVAKPSSLRYDLIGPHGGAIEAFATDGTEMQLLLPNDHLFIYGPATAANIDKLMRLAPLHRDAEGWVALLFGEVRPQPGAVLRYDETVGRFVLSWKEGGFDLTITVDPVTSQVVTAAMARAGELVSEVEVTGRDAKAVPTALEMKVPGADIDMRVILRDLEYDPDSLGEDDFVLRPPRGFELRHLDALNGPPSPQPPPRAGEADLEPPVE